MPRSQGRHLLGEDRLRDVYLEASLQKFLKLRRHPDDSPQTLIHLLAHLLRAHRAHLVAGRTSSCESPTPKHKPCGYAPRGGGEFPRRRRQATPPVREARKRPEQTRWTDRARCEWAQGTARKHPPGCLRLEGKAISSRTPEDFLLRSTSPSFLGISATLPINPKLTERANNTRQIEVAGLALQSVRSASIVLSWAG